MFEYPLDLHYSQTLMALIASYTCLNTLWIYTTLKPRSYQRSMALCLNTLWIYTTLKLEVLLNFNRFV